MSRKVLISLILSSLVVALLAVSPAQAQSRPRRPVLSTLLVNEAPDFASDQLANAWDFAGAGDLPDVVGLTHTRFRNVSPADRGVWKGTADRLGHVRLLQSWMSLPNGRDGEATPINADRYTHISIRMRLTGSSSNRGQLSWFDCGRVAPECRGSQSFQVFQGWHTYNFRIADDGGAGNVDWAGEIRGLVLTPAAAGGQIELDWVRLYRPTNAAVTVRARDNRPGVRLIWDRDLNPGNNTSDNRNWGVISNSRSGTFNTDAMAPAKYFIYSESNGQRSFASAITVNRRPQVRILQPDAIGGADYATTLRRDPWDFSQRSDVEQTRNMTFNIANGTLIGTNTGPTRSDSGFEIAIPDRLPINGSRFTNFSARVFYEGGFSLSGNPGGGMNARLVWITRNGDIRVTEDIVVFPGWNTITIDLDDVPPQRLIEGGARSSLWDGQQIARVRFDAHEDSGTRRFRVDWIRISENDKPVNGRVVVSFRDRAYQRGTTAKIFLDRNGDGAGDRQIGTVNVVNGRNVFRWTVPRSLVGSGEWFVTTELTDPHGARTTTTSTGTVEL